MVFTLFNKNTPVADIKFNMRRGYISEIEKFHNPEFCPLGLMKEDKTIHVESLSDWWEERSIPDTRKNVEKVLEQLQKGKYELMIQSLGLSLSDQYWIKPQGLDLQWKDINFFTNDFSEAVGELFFYQKGLESSDQLNYSSPDFTSNGFLDKRWIIENGERYLLKNGHDIFRQQPFNEKIASDILGKINCKAYIAYEVRDTDGAEPYSICKNFVTENTEYVPASLIRKISEKQPNESEYAYFMKCCNKVNVMEMMKNYLNYTLPFDYLIGNVDRNYGNFGFIRNVETLKIEGMAPIFDNGNSLWYNDALITQTVKSYPFEFNQENQIKFVTDFNKLPLHKLTNLQELCFKTLKLNKRCSEDRIQDIVKALGERKKMLAKLIDKDLHR